MWYNGTNGKTSTLGGENGYGKNTKKINAWVGDSLAKKTSVALGGVVIACMLVMVIISAFLSGTYLIGAFFEPGTFEPGIEDYTIYVSGSDAENKICQSCNTIKAVKEGKKLVDVTATQLVQSAEKTKKQVDDIDLLHRQSG